MKSSGYLAAAFVTALFFIPSAHGNTKMVVKSGGGCGTPGVDFGINYTFTADAAGGSNASGVACPEGFTFKNNSATTSIGSLTVMTGELFGIPTDPCSQGSFSGDGLFVNATCSFNSQSQIQTIFFSGIGPCGQGTGDHRFIGTCLGVAPHADFIFDLGPSGWLDTRGNPESFTFTASPSPTPEPASLLLFGGALGCLGYLKRRWTSREARRNY